MDVDELSFAPAAVPLRVRLSHKHPQGQSLCLNQLQKYMSQRIYKAPQHCHPAPPQQESMSLSKRLARTKMLQRHRANLLQKNKSIGRPLKISKQQPSHGFFQEQQFDIRVESFQPYQTQIQPVPRPPTKVELPRAQISRTRTAGTGRGRNRPGRDAKSEDDSMCGVGSWETGVESHTTSFLFR